MSQRSDQPDKVTVDYAALSSQATKVGLQVGVLTLGIVLISVFGGLWLDKLFGTKPILTIILVLASAPLSLWLTVRVAKRAVYKKPPPAAQGRDATKPEEGDTTGE
jgi:F0F1-type ATP synthase assembly protein I